jgi:ubiquinone/menaquinone biosynthesis C-methylase UbiE
MEHAELVAMIRDGVTAGAWADLGSGDGAFTLALADLLGLHGSIVSVDRDGGALRRQREAMQARFPATRVEYLHADFTRPLELPRLDGIVMANSLHFARNKGPVLELVRRALRPGGRLVLVEYDADRGNPWVPHPLSFGTWERVSEAAGLKGTRLLARRPSRFLNAMYSALSHTDDGQS